MDQICANCCHYKGGDNPECRKGNRYFGYLRHMKCFNTTSQDKAEPRNKAIHFIKDGVEMKICKGCLKELPLTKFAKNKTSKSGYQGLCHQCFYERYVLKDKRKK